MMLNDVIHMYKNYLITTDKSKQTIKAYLSDLSSFQFFLERKYNCPMYIEDLKVEDIEDFLFYLKEEKNSLLLAEVDINIH